jgi:hypothetical protein
MRAYETIAPMGEKIKYFVVGMKDLVVRIGKEIRVFEKTKQT